MKLRGKELYTTYGEFVLSSQPTEMMILSGSLNCCTTGTKKKEGSPNVSLNHWMRHGIVLFRKGENICLGRVERVTIITDTFSMFTSVPEEIPEQAMALIERFVVLLYNRTSSQTTVNYSLKATET